MQIGFSFIIPEFNASSFDSAQQKSLCDLVTVGWENGTRSGFCTIGKVSTFNDTSALVNGYGYFYWQFVPTGLEFQAAQMLRDRVVINLTNNITGMLGALFPKTVPNCACDGMNTVTKASSLAFKYNTNITGIPGPMQCGARLT